ncbi:hypothetical protein QR680_015663 [Steinernema hermaphroditum]|uniref:G-protein coupled receptors family 1 profile domain-containing protein n=1 Tax=Steinernema hermaphroditum TaxID=289476 RepID=A0AA39H8K5_9BILA|nr:hypothetical protein QR680_015663 [Steinernema hermaphroditum]KAK0401242.1 hypothetical protein QR680_015663 [Steinernema hermaphroditum]
MMEPNSPEGIVLGSISALTSIIYIYVLVIIAKNRDLRHAPFYMLNLAMGIVDIGNIWTTYVFQRIPAVGFLNDEVYLLFGHRSILATMCTQGFGFFNSTQKYYLIAIGFNRFTAVVTPSFHKTVWTKKHTLIVIVIAAAVNFVQNAVLEIISPSYWEDYRSEDSNDGLHCRMPSESIYKGGLQYSIYLSLAAAIVMCLLYGVIIFALFSNRHKLKTASSSTRKTYNVEMKLTLSVLLHTVLLTADGCTATLIFLAKQRYLMPYSYVIQDLLSGCNPYLLLFFSSELRKKVFWWTKVFQSPNASSIQPIQSMLERNSPRNRQ